MPPITFHSSALGGGVTNGVIASHPQTLQQWMERCVLLYLTSRGCFSMHLRLCVILFTGWSYCGCSHCVIMSYCVSHLCEGIQTRRTIQSQIKKSYSSLFTKHFHHTFHSYKQPPPPSLILSLSDRDTWPKSHHSLSPALHSEVKWDDRLIAIASKRGHWCVKRENGRRVMETERELGCTCRRGGQGESEKIDCAAVRWWAIFNEKETEWIDFRSTSA